MPARGPSFKRRQTVSPTRHQAVVIARHAGAADVGTDVVDAAGRRLADLPAQCRTAGAVAAHAGFVGSHVFLRDKVELRVILGGEARPSGRVGAAGATGLAIEGNRVGALLWRRKIPCDRQGKQPWRRFPAGILLQGRYFFFGLRGGASAGDLNRSVPASAASPVFGAAAGLAGFTAAAGAAGWPLAENLIAISILVRETR